MTDKIQDVGLVNPISVATQVALDLKVNISDLAEPVINGTAARFEFVATASQTTFVTSGFDSGYADVYQNGIKLINTVDFDDTDGINIILTNGANLDDEISVIAYGTFVLADHYSKAVSDARYLQLTGGTVTGPLTATDFIGPLNGAVQFTAKNDEGIAITKGQAVYIKGVSGDVATVGLADANDSTKMPAFGLVAVNANNNAEVEIVTFGSLADTKTDYTGWAFGDTLYVSTTPGLLTNSAPAGEASKIQNIGKVQRVHASAGIIRTGGAGRTNATPNLDDGNVFIGNASNQSVSRALVVADTTGLQTALDLKANQATTYTKTETDTAISNLVAAAPATLDTLNELAAALGDDPNFATTVTNSIALKAPLASPSFTGDIAVTGNVDGRDIAVDGTKLDGVETGATADQTAAQILTAIKTVDGPNSNLDADLLDGQHGSYYYPASNPDGYISSYVDTNTWRSISDSVTSTSSTVSASSTAVKAAYDRSWPNSTYNFSGSSFVSRNTGNPIAIDSATTNMVGYVNSSTAAGYADGAGFTAAYSTSWVGQLFVDFRTGKLSTRGKNNGTWQAHRFMWDNLNDGSGSGLDADLLDGVQGSSFLRSDATDTCSGNINFTSGIKLDGHVVFNGTDTWMRTSGSTGWYNASYGGGMYMTDTTWVTVYASKALKVNNQIAATGNITAYYSDERLKTKTGAIDNALEKVQSLHGFMYVENDIARSLGYNNGEEQVALSAQDVQRVMPQAVSLAPCDMETDEFSGEITSKSGEDYLTVDYSRLVPLLVEAIKEQQIQIDELKARLNNNDI